MMVMLLLLLLLCGWCSGSTSVADGVGCVSSMHGMPAGRRGGRERGDDDDGDGDGDDNHKQPQ